ncbi:MULTISPECIES: hypothetical protein [unclassified Burkholderia]|uniref:hypothetical protein n=1 Tax=unclassified Burkholderia TaxID=2613784 RepID=UPI00117F8047|nr:MULTISPECIES: hypothetical protein [unclassified Burkholderia]MCA8063404.1 hypothetical protein [Burkholderia sp. AU38729]
MDFSLFRLVPLIKTIDPAPMIIRHAARLAARRGTSMPRGVASATPPNDVTLTFRCEHPATVVAAATVASTALPSGTSQASQGLTVPQRLFIHYKKFPEFSVCLTKQSGVKWLWVQSSAIVALQRRRTGGVL